MNESRNDFRAPLVGALEQIDESVSPIHGVRWEAKRHTALDRIALDVRALTPRVRFYGIVAAVSNRMALLMIRHGG